MPEHPPLVLGKRVIGSYNCVTVGELARQTSQVFAALGLPGPAGGTGADGADGIPVELPFQSRVCLTTDYTDGVAQGVYVDENWNPLPSGETIEVPDPTRRWFSAGTIRVDSAPGSGSIVNIDPPDPSIIFPDDWLDGDGLYNADLVIDDTYYKVLARQSDSQLILVKDDLDVPAETPYFLRERIGQYEGLGKNTCGPITTFQGEPTLGEQFPTDIPGGGGGGGGGGGTSYTAGPGIDIGLGAQNIISTDNDATTYLEYTGIGNTKQNAIRWDHIPGYLQGGINPEQLLGHSGQQGGGPNGQPWGMIWRDQKQWLETVTKFDGAKDQVLVNKKGTIEWQETSTADQVLAIIKGTVPAAGEINTSGDLNIVGLDVASAGYLSWKASETGFTRGALIVGPVEVSLYDVLRGYGSAKVRYFRLDGAPYVVGVLNPSYTPYVAEGTGNEEGILTLGTLVKLQDGTELFVLPAFDHRSGADFDKSKAQWLLHQAGDYEYKQIQGWNNDSPDGQSVGHDQNGDTAFQDDGPCP